MGGGGGGWGRGRTAIHHNNALKDDRSTALCELFKVEERLDVEGVA